jgi:uncharacterized protein DUF6585
MKVLGAPLQHFGCNRLWAVFFSIGTLMFAALAIVPLAFAKADYEWWETLVGVVFGLCCLYALLSTLTASVTLCENGFRFTTLRKKGELLWDDIEKFRYAVITTYHQGIIPTTHYTMILVDKGGQRADLGSNVQNPKEVARLLWARLQAPLLQKTIAAYDSGQTLDLGAIKLSFDWIEMSTGLRKINIPVANVTGCSIDKGVLTIGERVNGKLKFHTAMLNRVDNAFALVELINSRVAKQTLSAGAGR